MTSIIAPESAYNVAPAFREVLKANVIKYFNDSPLTGDYNLNEEQVAVDIQFAEETGEFAIMAKIKFLDDYDTDDFLLFKPTSTHIGRDVAVAAAQPLVEEINLQFANCLLNDPERYNWCVEAVGSNSNDRESLFRRWAIALVNSDKYKPVE